MPSPHFEALQAVSAARADQTRLADEIRATRTKLADLDVLFLHYRAKADDAQKALDKVMATQVS